MRHEAAVRAFELDSTAELADALLKTADDPDFRVRLWACAALGKSRDARALPKLIQHLDDPELFVRYRAAQGLEYLGNPGAVPALEKMMRERSWYEGVYALEALRRIRPGQY
jgi:HEAT repeat protein